MGSIILAIILTMKHLVWVQLAIEYVVFCFYTSLNCTCFGWFWSQGKSRKCLRFLRAAGPLTAVVLGTTFVTIYHPSSITLVRITWINKQRKKHRIEQQLIIIILNCSWPSIWLWHNYSQHLTIFQLLF